MRSAVIARYPGLNPKVKFGAYRKISIRSETVLPDGRRQRASAHGWRPASALENFIRRIESQPELCSAVTC